MKLQSLTDRWECL